MSRVVHAIFEPAHVFWGTYCIFDQRNPRQACAELQYPLLLIYTKYTVKVGVLNPNSLENTFLLHFENTC